MGLFKGMKDAKSSEGGVYLTPGIYPKLEVLACKAGRTRKNRDFFVAELKVIEVKPTDEKSRKPDSRCSWMVMLDNDAALGNIKQFIAALFGCPEEEVDEDATESLVSDEQPGAGRFISAEAVNVQTKAGGDFTRVRWETIEQ